MNKGLRNSVAKALKKLNEANSAVQEIEPHLTFSGFRGDKPCVSVCSGGEIIQLIHWWASKKAEESNEDTQQITVGGEPVVEVKLIKSLDEF